MTVKIHTLSNGFRVVTERMPSMKSVSLYFDVYWQGTLLVVLQVKPDTSVEGPAQ